MDQYEPSKSPEPEEWQALDESERIDFVREFIQEGGEEIPEDAEHIHAVQADNRFVLSSLFEVFPSGSSAVSPNRGGTCYRRQGSSRLARRDRPHRSTPEHTEG